MATMIWTVLIFFIIGEISVEYVCAYKSGNKAPVGVFLLEQPENPEALYDHHGIPQHFEELNRIHKVEDKVKREAILNERIVRVKRSPKPQFSGGFGLNTNAGQKPGSIGASGGISLDAPSLPSGNAQADLSAGSLDFESTVGGSVSGGLSPGINLGGNIDLKQDLNVSPGGGAAVNVQGGIAGNSIPGAAVTLPSAEIKLDTGNSNLGAGLLLPSAGVKLDAGNSNLGAGIKLNAENASLGAAVTLPSAGINLDAGNSNFGAGVALPSARIKLDTGNTGAAVTLPSAEVNLDIGKSDLVEAVTLPSGEAKLDTGSLSTPKLNISVVSVDTDGKTTVKPSSPPSTEEENSTAKDDNATQNVTSPVTTPIPTVLQTTTVDPQIKGGELLLPPNYELLQIPKPDYGKSIGQYLPGPLICLVFVKILGISSFNEIDRTVTFDTDFTVEWIDGVIFDISDTFDRPPPTKKQVLAAQRTLSPAFLKKVWRPDLFMDGVAKVDQPSITNKAVLSLKFNKLTGFISYTVRMSVTVNCPMSFEYYPADTQHCDFRIASYSHTKDDMSLDWLVLDSKHIGVILDEDEDDNFDIKVDGQDKFEYTPKWNNAANSSYEVLTFSISARRKISYHLFQTYLPSVFHIFVTWLVFLIPYTLYDCRIGTTMTTLLTLTAMFSAVREQSPQVNYIKAIDLWMLSCVLFIFLNLLELSVMTWLRITIETYEEMEKKAEDEESPPDTEKKEHLDLGSKVTKWRIEKFRKVYSYIDRYSFQSFAGLFVLYNVVYWTWLFVASGYFTWVPNERNEL